MDLFLAARHAGRHLRHRRRAESRGLHPPCRHPRRAAERPAQRLYLRHPRGERLLTSGHRRLRSIFPTLAALQEVLALSRSMQEVMRMYVGNEPHLRILSGDVRRGEVLRIRAAILFADMRDFTGLNAHLSAEAATALVNQYYDCIVPPIDERGGEVLKFMGDGILAIFRPGEDADSEACLRAFAAARAGMLRVARHNRERDGSI